MIIKKIIISMFLLSIAITAGCLTKENAASTSSTSTGVTATPTATATTTTTSTSANNAGIPISVVITRFYDTKKWELNTLYVDPDYAVGRGDLVVRVKDIEHLQSFMIKGFTYGKFDYIKKKDPSGNVAYLITYRIKPGVDQKWESTGSMDVQVWNKLPEVDKTTGTVLNQAILYERTNIFFQRMPPDDGVFIIHISNT